MWVAHGGILNPSLLPGMTTQENSQLSTVDQILDLFWGPLAPSIDAEDSPGRALTHTSFHLLLWPKEQCIHLAPSRQVILKSDSVITEKRYCNINQITITFFYPHFHFKDFFPPFSGHSLVFALWVVWFLLVIIIVICTAMKQHVESVELLFPVQSNLSSQPKLFLTRSEAIPCDFCFVSL